MSLTARGHNYRLAIGKQSAEGTPQTTPAYEYSMYDGGIEPVKVEEPSVVTSTNDSPPAYFRSMSSSAGDPTLNSDVEAIGLPWKLHLGAESAGGSDDQYTHTITKQDAPLFATVYQKRPDIIGGTDLWEQANDVFVRGIELTASAGQPLRHKLDLIGKNHIFSIAAPTPTSSTVVRGGSTNQELTMIGATIEFDFADTTPNTQVRNVESLVLTSSFPNATWIHTDEYAPRYLDKGMYQLGISATVVFDSFAAYNATFWNDTTPTNGTAQSNLITVGSAQVNFKDIAATSNRSLDISMPSMVWEAQMPKADPSGAAVRMTLTAKVQAVTTPITVLLTNDLQTAY